MVTDVYDGDTFTGAFKIENQMYRFKFRMNGYDSAEKRITKVMKNELTEEEYNYMKDMAEKGK